MNLHAIVRGVISSVNPETAATMRVNTGYTTDAAGNRSANPYVDVPVSVQIQALSYQDLQLLDGLVLNGERRAMWVNGKFDSVNRPTNTGGDLVIFPDGNVWPFSTVWLIAQVQEQWDSWCHLICTQQNNA